MQNQGIRDARKLGTPKLLILGLQHMFAMFGATVLVPALTGLSVSATLLFAVLPFPDQGQGACLPGQLVCLPRRLCCHRA